jgi:hypothetical protein
LKKLDLISVPAWYQGYINAVPDMELLDLLAHSHADFVNLIEGLTEQESAFAYAEGKWTIKDLILHISDAERIFSYRALRIAREDQTVLSGYDHNQYVITADAGKRSNQQLLSEYQAIRVATIALFSGFSKVELMQQGKVDDNTFSPGMLGFIIAGHQMHHASIIRSKYLTKLRS